jgi:flavin reductase (DIM6/NTAB) family NADH-FMN oxidoreductase RutF
MQIDSEKLNSRDAYRLLISTIVPRPIAWVSTVGNDGSRNLAPFSFFNAIGGNPPTVMISVGSRHGQPKDTLRNIQENGEFVVNIVSESLAQHMNITSGEYDYSTNEFALAGLTESHSTYVKPPRVGEAGIAMECKLTQVTPVAETTYHVVFGKILCYHIRDGLLRQNGLIDAALLRPLMRLGGDEYATLGEVFEIKRPV